MKIHPSEYLKNSSALKIGIIAGCCGTALAAGLFVYDALRPTLQVEWTPGQTSTWIDPLFPPGRLDAPSEGNQTMRQEPAYTDIRIPKGYTTITLALDIENPDTIPVKYGFANVHGEYQLFSEPHTFAVSELAMLPERRVRLIISAPDMRKPLPGASTPSATPSLTIKGITVTYAK